MIQFSGEDGKTGRDGSEDPCKEIRYVWKKGRGSETYFHRDGRGAERNPFQVERITETKL